MAQAVEEWYKQMPIITRSYLTAAIVTTIGCSLDVSAICESFFSFFFLFLGRVGLGRETLKLLVWLMMIIRFHSDTIFLGLLFSPFLRLLIFWYCSRWFLMHCDVNFLMSSKVGWILRLMMFSQLKNVMFRFPFFADNISLQLILEPKSRCEALSILAPHYKLSLFS